VLAELTPALTALAQIAKAQGIGMTIDAEEAERLELSLEIFARLRRDPTLAGWEGLGLAVQAYQKRALAVIDWLIALASECRLRIPVRLVKGAYWDTEIKRAQVQGLDAYPVFTRKAHTDVSYLACAQRMLGSAGSDGALFPMFATHNAHTVASIVERALQSGLRHDAFEFQRLHGMGEALYEEIVAVKEACGPAHLKVILETGELGTYDNVRRASILAMAAGADFIKTSTGKVQPAATLPVSLVMMEAIRDFVRETGRPVGIKPAGGIRTSKQAIAYLVVLYETLGAEWMTPERFRLGASTLLNDVLMQIEKERTGAYQSGDYFTID
jgi:hypothetical protein